MSFIDRLTLVCNNDPNLIRFDGASFKFLEIDGAGGLDTFTNQNEATGLAVFSNSLGTLTRLHGGGQGDRLTLSDTSGGAGDYDLARQTSRLPATHRASASSSAASPPWKSLEAISPISRRFAETQRRDAQLRRHGWRRHVIVGGGDLDASGLGGATLGGGDGTDHIILDDRFDDHSSFDADTLSIEFNSINKDGVIIAYGSFESQSIISSGVNSGPLAYPTTVKINAIAIPTEIIDVPGDRDTIVEVGHGQFGLNQIFAPITLASSDSMELRVYDLLSTTNKQFVVGVATITQNNAPLPLSMSHSGLDSISILAGNTDDQIIVEAVVPGPTSSATVAAGMTWSRSETGPSNIKGPVHFAGGAGLADKIIFSNLFDFASDFIESTLTASSFQAGDGPLHQFFNGVEQALSA